MKTKKILCLISAAAMAVSMCGCSIKLGTNKKIKDDVVVAHAAGAAAEGKTGLDITYGDFKKDYTYYLQANSITDDSEESVAETCKQQRETIINYLITERVILDKANEMGLGTLTDEELAELDEEFNAQVAEQVEYFGENANYGTLAEGETITDAQKEERGNAEFDAYLESCGLTRDDLYLWQINSVITNKVVDETVKDISVDRSEAETEFEELVNSVKELYESSPSDYESGSYSSVWVPDGSRRIKHVLLSFEDSVQDEITSLRSADDAQGADELREEKAQEFAEQTEEIVNMLVNGADIDELILVYSGDSASSSLYPDGYLLLPNGTTFMDEFQQAAFEIEEIGGVITCVTDYGVHILQYVSDAVVSEEDKNEFIDYFDDTLNTNAKNEYFNNLLEQWEEEYGYEINYDALKIDDPADVKSESSDSAEQAG